MLISYSIRGYINLDVEDDNGANELLYETPLDEIISKSEQAWLDQSCTEVV